jgi:hypothetical protein
MNKLFASSSDPKQVSLTIRAQLIALVPIIAMIVKYFGGEISNHDLELLASTIADIVAFLGVLAYSITTCIGIVRRVLNTFR